MKLSLSFLGAAGNVTGSRYLLEANASRILVDCGLYQERELKRRNWESFPVPPETLDAILLTHAHIDHCGLLPKLVREGFRGVVYGTDATCELVKIVLRDSARLQEEDAAFKRKRHKREGRKGRYPEIPLYTVEDAEAALSLLSPVRYGKAVELAKGVNATFYDAGHVLGSAIIEVAVTQGQERTILFSGDVGRWDKLLLPNPTVFDEADYVLVESTYGDRLHEGSTGIAGDLAEVINSTRKAGGNIVVPSFALERTQEILYYMNELLHKDSIPHLMVFLDSPMAASITEVFKSHLQLLNQSIYRSKSPFDFPGLKVVQTIDESKALNHVKGTVMIIAGSGMCTGGRIKHHLVTNISRPESTILFVGYQAVGTLGRQIVDGAEEVRILGRMYPVRARIAQIHGLSAHADRDELFKWLSALKKPPRRLFVTHGEAEAARNFAEYVRGRTGWSVSVPEYGAKVFLE